MATFTSMAQYREVTKERLKRIEKGGNRSVMRAAKYAVLQNRSMAPRKTGTLLANIRKVKRGLNHWAVESWVPGGFKYNLWVNGNIDTVRLPTTSDFSKDAPRRARTYASTRHTGTPGYFNIAAKKTAKMFHNLNIRIVPNAIGGTN